MQLVWILTCICFWDASLCGSRKERVTTPNHSSCQTDLRAGEALQRADWFTFLLVFRSTELSPWLPKSGVALLWLYFLPWQNATNFSVAGDRQEIFFHAGKRKKKLKKYCCSKITNLSNFNIYPRKICVLSAEIFFFPNLHVSFWFVLKKKKKIL